MAVNSLGHTTGARRDWGGRGAILTLTEVQISTDGEPRPRLRKEPRRCPVLLRAPRPLVGAWLSAVARKRIAQELGRVQA